MRHLRCGLSHAPNRFGAVEHGRGVLRKFVLVFGAAFLLAACSDGGTEPIDRTKTIVRGVNYIGLSVSDLDQATAFYAETADLTVVEDGIIENSAAFDAAAGRESVTARTRLMKSVNAQLKFMEFDNRSPQALATPAVPVNGPGIAHVCVQAKKELQTFERFLEAGATPRNEPAMVQLNSKNPVEYAYVHDRDGIMVEIEHVDVAALNLPEPPKNDSRIRHFALATPDIDRLVDFYSVLLEEPEPRRFGWSFWGISGEKFDKVSGLPGTELRMAWFQVRNLELEIGEYLSHPPKLSATPRAIDAVGYNLIVFDVSDLDAARAKFLEAGGTIVGDVDQQDGGQILYGRDPDGNLIGLQVLDSQAPASSQNFNGNGT